MAIAQGAFSNSVVGPGTGAYGYVAGAVQPQFYAGTFIIDTGYDDPNSSWTAGVDCAELYQARVYGFVGSISPAVGAGVYTGKWLINATPIWSSKFWGSPSGNQIDQRRVLIKCEVWLAEPVSKADGAWQRLDNVQWTLYRA